MYTLTQPANSSLERVSFDTNVSYRGAGRETYSVRCCDLSSGGIYLQVKQNLRKGENLFLDFTIPIADKSYEVLCKARVAWTNYEENKVKDDYPPGVGLEFIDLAEDDVATLVAFIDGYDESKKMNMVCAWCGKHLGARKGPCGKISHGICGECKQGYM